MKHVKHVDRPRKAHCIDCAKRVAVMTFNNFQDSRPLALPWLCRCVFVAKLSRAQSEPYAPLHLGREAKDRLKR